MSVPQDISQGAKVETARCWSKESLSMDVKHFSVSGR